MGTRSWCCLAVAVFAGFALQGCASSGQPPEAPQPLPVPGGFRPIVSGASDTVSSVPGSPGALYRYRFRMTQPGSSAFNFQDRDLSFYFRPTPDALHFQIENRQDWLVEIDWERSSFLDPYGRTGKVAHGTTRWDDRFKGQPTTQIPGLQRYSDYAFPFTFLVDPAGSPEQLHRPLLPEDSTAPQYSNREFGLDLAVTINGTPRTYTVRFTVASVIPR